MKNDITLAEAEELYEKSGATTTINDGEITRISRGTAPAPKPELPRYSNDEIEGFLNALSAKERKYLLSKMSWLERLESLAEKMDADTRALDVIYLRAKEVRC
jgi:hypothetical protein